MAREKRSIEEKSIWPIAKGVSLLFIANIFAICISMALVSAWYGFGRAKLQRLLACPRPYCSFLALNQITFR